MRRIAYLTPVVVLFGAASSSFAQTDPLAPRPAAVSSGSAQLVQAPAYRPPAAYAPVASSSVDGAIAQWRQLRQSDRYPFATYAYFILSNPGFPGETGLRKSAERAMVQGESPAMVIAFFRDKKPLGGNGWARLAESYAASGRAAEALGAARSAWASSDLAVTDESALLARFGRQLLPADHDRRTDALLFDKKVNDAIRMLGWTSPARRPAFAARIAMQQGTPDAEARFAIVAGQVSRDAGLMMARARYLRDKGSELAARSIAAQPHAFTERPADIERYYDMLVILARGASADRQWTTAYNIARQLDDALPPGELPSSQSYGVRDNYTTLAWLGGTAAAQAGRNADAATMFERYARGGKSLQVASKGYYWAARSWALAGRPVDAARNYEKAAATPELFYSQLALERLGRAVPAPGAAPSARITPAQRSAFQNRRLVLAVRQLGRQGYRSDQALFVRALSESLDSDTDRVLAAELAAQLGRQDLAVWTARSARNSGDAFYYRPAYPTHSFAASSGRTWSLAHGITRQESSFDRSVVSHANAHGMMQLLPSTGREQAGKMGVGFDTGRLTSDPAFNVMLGTAYFQRLLDSWGGSYPLAVASYNAGSGNVRKWVNANGDPRTGAIDMISWIERIPFEETRGYVQRVLENSVVYDTINPTVSHARPVALSSYLGRSGYSSAVAAK